MQSPYDAPEEYSVAAGPNPKRRFWKKMVGTSLAIIILPLVISLIGTSYGMFRNFNRISEGGTAEDLSHYISLILTVTALGIVGSIFGLILLIISMIRLSTLPKSVQGPFPNVPLPTDH